jgi:hypothetical protein
MAMRQVPTYCYQCVAGPDLLNVVVEDGVAVKVEPNFGVKEHPAGALQAPVRRVLIPTTSARPTSSARI